MQFQWIAELNEKRVSFPTQISYECERISSREIKKMYESILPKTSI